MAPLTDPSLPPQERMQMLEALAWGLSPMHPKDWQAIKAEYDKCEREVADG